MKKILFTLLLAVLFVSCSEKQHKKRTDDGFVVKELNTASPDCDQYVLMSTSYGNIKIKLYRETPLHRKNFINLVMNGYYNGQIFYRVDRGSLIQAGDYTSIKDPDRPDIGIHDVDYKIQSEIDPTKRIHKRGVIAAASSTKGGIESSGSHFYIVAQKNVSEKKLAAAERNFTEKVMADARYIELYKQNSKKLNELNKLGKKNSEKATEYKQMLRSMKQQAIKETKGKKFKYSNAQRKTYLEKGGLPHLDHLMTVFGEVVEGMHVVDAIASVSVSDGRPNENVFIKKITVINGNK